MKGPVRVQLPRFNKRTQAISLQTSGLSNRINLHMAILSIRQSKSNFVTDSSDVLLYLNKTILSQYDDSCYGKPETLLCAISSAGRGSTCAVCITGSWWSANVILKFYTLILLANLAGWFRWTPSMCGKWQVCSGWGTVLWIWGLSRVQWHQSDIRLCWCLLFHALDHKCYNTRYYNLKWCSTSNCCYHFDIIIYIYFPTLNVSIACQTLDLNI